FSWTGGSTDRRNAGLSVRVLAGREFPTRPTPGGDERLARRRRLGARVQDGTRARGIRLAPRARRRVARRAVHLPALLSRSCAHQADETPKVAPVSASAQ